MFRTASKLLIKFTNTLAVIDCQAQNQFRIWVKQFHFVQFLLGIKCHTIHVICASISDLRGHFTRIRKNDTCRVFCNLNYRLNLRFARTIKIYAKGCQGFQHNRIRITFNRIIGFHHGENGFPLVHGVNDLAQMQIKAAVAEADIGNVEVGQDVTFTVDAFPNRQFRGRVEQLRNLPTTTQNVVTYATIINVRNDDLKLKPGMTANVSIVIARRGATLRIPNAALRARIPEAYLVAKPAPTGPAAIATSPAPGSAPATPGKSGGEARPGGDRREQFRQLMADAGVDFRAGPPAPEALARLQALARERGIELPERFMGSRNDNGGSGAAVTTRTVYKLAGTPTQPLAEPVTVKLGITDGSFTEVHEGLAEGDVLISSFAAPESGAANQPARNPFSGARRPF